MHRRLATIVVLACGCTVAGAQPADRDPFVAVEDADPMELARAVDRTGDDAVLARLREDRLREVRLAAIEAAPWMRAPELALEPLLTLARGRDPRLAPAAAQAALAIANGLSADELARREAELDALTSARRLASSLAGDESARADLRAAAATVAARLDQLGVR
ncbi:MAG TPA: hypothetical protein VIL20_04735 [Sandaracinaceae bacterium]